MIRSLERESQREAAAERAVSLAAAMSGILMLLQVGAAQADWEYTRWEMSLDEVVVASRGKANPLTPGEQLLRDTINSPEVGRLKAVFTMEPGLDVDAYFYFDDDLTLQRVLIVIDGLARARRVHQLMTERYGSPDRSFGGILPEDEWTSIANGDLVSMSRAFGASNFFVSHAPPVTAVRLARLFGWRAGLAAVCNYGITEDVMTIWHRFAASIPIHLRLGALDAFEASNRRTLERGADPSYRRRSCRLVIYADIVQAWDRQLTNFLEKLAR